MIIAIAPDKYKGTLSPRVGCRSHARGVLAVCPDAEIHIVPMADGGEGTAEIIAPEMGYARYEAVIHAPVEGLPSQRRYITIIRRIKPYFSTPLLL